MIPAAALAEVGYERDADGTMIKVERESFLDKLAYTPGSKIPNAAEFFGAAVDGKELVDEPEPPTQQPPASSKLGVNLFLAAAIGGGVIVGTRGADSEEPAPTPPASLPDDEGAPADTAGADSDSYPTDVKEG